MDLQSFILGLKTAKKLAQIGALDVVLAKINEAMEEQNYPFLMKDIFTAYMAVVKSLIESKKEREEKKEEKEEKKEGEKEEKKKKEIGFVEEIKEEAKEIVDFIIKEIYGEERKTRIEQRENVNVLREQLEELKRKLEEKEKKKSSNFETLEKELAEAMDERAKEFDKKLFESWVENPEQKKDNKKN